jgi:hypothetical protein
MLSAVKASVGIGLLFLAGALWLNFCHDPKVEREGRLKAERAAVDSAYTAWSDSLARIGPRVDTIIDTLTVRLPAVQTRTPAERAAVVERLVADTAWARNYVDSVHRTLDWCAQLTEACREYKRVADSVRLAGLARVEVRDAQLRSESSCWTEAGVGYLAGVASGAVIGWKVRGGREKQAQPAPGSPAGTRAGWRIELGLRVSP